MNDQRETTPTAPTPQKPIGWMVRHPDGEYEGMKLDELGEALLTYPKFGQAAFVRDQHAEHDTEWDRAELVPVGPLPAGVIRAVPGFIVIDRQTGEPMAEEAGYSDVGDVTAVEFAVDRPSAINLLKASLQETRPDRDVQIAEATLLIHPADPYQAGHTAPTADTAAADSGTETEGNTSHAEEPQAPEPEAERAQPDEDDDDVTLRLSTWNNAAHALDDAIAWAPAGENPEFKSGVILGKYAEPLAMIAALEGDVMVRTATRTDDTRKGFTIDTRGIRIRLNTRQGQSLADLINSGLLDVDARGIVTVTSAGRQAIRDYRAEQRRAGRTSDDPVVEELAPWSSVSDAIDGALAWCDSEANPDKERDTFIEFMALLDRFDGHVLLRTNSRSMHTRGGFELLDSDFACAIDDRQDWNIENMIEAGFLEVARSSGKVSVTRKGREAVERFRHDEIDSNPTIEVVRERRHAADRMRFRPAT